MKIFTVDFQDNNPVKFKKNVVRVMKNQYSKYHKTHPILKQTYNISGVYVSMEQERFTIRLDGVGKT